VENFRYKNGGLILSSPHGPQIKPDTEQLSSHFASLSMDTVMQEASPLFNDISGKSQIKLKQIEQRKEKTDLIIRGRRGMKYADKKKRCVKPISVEEVKVLVKREMEIHANKSELFDVPDPILLEYESRNKNRDNEAEHESDNEDEENTKIGDYYDVDELLNYRNEDVDYSKKEVWKGPEEMVHFIPEEYK